MPSQAASTLLPITLEQLIIFMLDLDSTKHYIADPSFSMLQ